MNISLNWIKKYIPGLEIEDFEGLKAKMVDCGLDIESIESKREKFSNFVVAEVVEKDKHPNADKLSLCKVNDGSHIYSVVCGAPNVEIGQKVCFAKIGAIVPGGNFEIKKSKIRGELSEGMICAQDELGLSEDHSGIMVLDKDAKIGMEFADYIGANDYLIEIGITPNRGDLLSHFGIAREIAALHNLDFIKPKIELKESEKKSEDFIKIRIDNPEFCMRFTGRVVNNIEVKESPDWLKKSLLSIGLRPRNNIVDITNFVMFETGQPLHAFDYDKIKGSEIIVKTANEGDKFITLDSKERVLNDKSLMVCDADGYSAIAGIMGGEFSEITDTTKNVFIESAYFDPVCVRKNSKKLSLQTDASHRFERGVDIENVEYASHRAAMLLQEIANGDVLKGIVDIYPEKFEKQIVSMRMDRAIKLLGKELNENVTIEKLGKIDIKFIEKKDNKLFFEIPEFRRLDVEREVDIIEEVARLFGYEYFESEGKFRFDTGFSSDSGEKEKRFINNVRDYFIGRGFNEIISYSQQDEKKIISFTENYVKVANPNSIEMNVMRTNLRYGLLNTLQINHNYSGKDIPIKLFEIGNVFSNSENNFLENTLLGIGISGNFDGYSFVSKDRHFDFLDLKGEIENLFTKLNIESYEFIYYYGKEKDYRVADVMVNKNVIGNLYIYDESFKEFIEKENSSVVCEIDLKKLFKAFKPQSVYKEISKYPLVKRDLAIVSEASVHYTDIEDKIKLCGGKNLKGLKLFDLYEDKKLGVNKKSYAFTLEFGSDEKTLTDDEVTKYIEKIIRTLEKELKTQLRQ